MHIVNILAVAERRIRKTQRVVDFIEQLIYRFGSTSVTSCQMSIPYLKKSTIMSLLFYLV